MKINAKRIEGATRSIEKEPSGNNENSLDHFGPG